MQAAALRVVAALSGISALCCGLCLAQQPASEVPVRTLIDRGHYQEAEDAARAQLARTENEHDAGSAAVADALDLFVEALVANARVRKPGTLEQARRAVELRAVLVGREHPDMIPSLVNLGEALRMIGEYAESEQLLREALVIAEAVYGSQDPRAARIMNPLAITLLLAGETEAARALFERALTALEPAPDSFAVERGHSRFGLGYTLSEEGNAESAGRQYQAALEIWQEALGSEHPLVAMALLGLGQVQRRLGNVDRARELYEHAFAIASHTLRDDHRELAPCLNSLAIMAKADGDYLQARRLLERALAISEAEYGPEHRMVAGALNNLANLSVLLGDFPAARRYTERGHAIREKVHGPDHPSVAQSLNVLAQIDIELGRLDEAEQLARRSLVIREQAFGADSSEVAATLGTLGVTLTECGRFDEAQQVLQRAVDLSRLGFVDESIRLLGPMLSLARCKLGMGALDEAATGFDEAATLLRSTYGSHHPNLAVALKGSALVAAARGNAAQALRLALEVDTCTRRHLRLTVQGMSEWEALRYGVDRHFGLDLALTVAGSGSLPRNMVEEVLDACIRSRGLVLNEMALRRRISASGSPEVRARMDELMAAANRYSQLLTGGADSGAPGRLGQELEEARQQLEIAERRLGESSAALQAGPGSPRIGLAEVRANLPRGTALVSYVRFAHIFDPRNGLWSRGHRLSYLAIVTGPDGTVRMVPLGAAAIVDDAVRGWRAEAGHPPAGNDPATYRAAGETLRSLIWDPLTGALRGAERVFVAPDGTLHLVNLAALPSGTDSYLLESGPLLHMLSDERDLVPVRQERAGSSTLVAFTNPDFDESSAGPSSPGAAALSRGTSVSLADFSDVQFRPLPSTAAETTAIASLWLQEVPEGAVTVLTGEQASEAMFKRLATQATVLHLATHGFFLAASVTAQETEGRGVGGLVPAAPAPEPSEPSRPVDSFDLYSNPLLLSGLALAGANNRAAPGPQEQDGILTADEIATLDLRSVEWAVLSACDSGLGKTLSASEGVYGLRRAFRIAGARTVITSLWAVEDETARQWMEALYRARLQDGLTTAEAVRQASLTVLTTHREQGTGTHPFSWGGFIAVGDWR